MSTAGLQAGAWAGGTDPLVCEDVRPEVEGVATFRFRAASGAGFAFLPGQFVTLAVPLAAGTAWRSFTIASAPTRPRAIELTIKVQGPDGATRWLHDHLRPGMSLAARGPAGRFHPGPAPTRPLALLSAGSGATPMAAIARWLHDKRLTVPVHYLHVARHHDELLFRDEIEAIAAALGSWRVDWLVTRPDRGVGGRPDAAALAARIAGLDGCDVFCCGPDGFRAAARAAHRTVGGLPERFHEESFDTAPPAAMTAEAADAAATGHLVRFEPQGVEVVAAPGETVLAAAARAGLAIASSCRQGICGTCRVRRLAGRVEMRQDGGLDDEDIETGHVLACCSYPLSALTIEAS